MNLLKGILLALLFIIEPIRSQSKIELFDLIKIFVPTGQYNGDVWETGAGDNSPINWETIGIKDVDSPPNRYKNGNKDVNSDLGSYYRKGNVIITINKKPLYILKKKMEALPWDIKLYGPRSGISAIMITNDLLSGENIFNPVLVEDYFKKKGCKINLLKCDDKNHLDYGTRLYSLIIQKKKLYVFLDFTSGSAGFSGDMILLFNEPNETFYLKRKLTNNDCN